MLKISKGNRLWVGSLKPLERCDGGGGDGSDHVEWTQEDFILGAKS